MNKRGDMEWTIIEIVVALVALWIILTVVTIGMKGCEKTYDLRKCHDALFLESQIASKFTEAGQAAKPWPNVCQTQGPIIIKDKDKEAVMNKIASYMAMCWWSMGESGKQGFDPFAKNLALSSIKCFNCFFIKVENVGITKDEMNYWLLTHNMEGSKTTYWNYIHGFSSEEDRADKWMSYFPTVVQDIKMGQYYSINYADYQSSISAGVLDSIRKSDFCSSYARWAAKGLMTIPPFAVQSISYQILCANGETTSGKAEASTEDYLQMVEWNQVQDKCSST